MLLRPRIAACATFSSQHYQLLVSDFVHWRKDNSTRHFATSGHRPRNSKNSSNNTNPENKRISPPDTSANINEFDAKNAKRKGSPPNFKREQRPKQSRRIDLKDTSSSQQNTAKSPNLIQPTTYYYSAANALQLFHREDGFGDRTNPLRVLPSLNAEALLDPLKYCKVSSKNSHSHGVSRGISGTDAARRLLRGKKDFIYSARALKAEPVLLEGHGVPPKLFQHCIDMADALLLQFSPDAMECTFHNYTQTHGNFNILPTIMRTRSRDATNRCTPWPPENSTVTDWDYHLELYLTVMERLACHLSQVLLRKTAHFQDSTTISRDEYASDVDELTSSPFLFPYANAPQWNVDILRGSYFDFKQVGPSGGMLPVDTPPMPIVEFTEESQNLGHVLIRLQGYSSANREFGAFRSQFPVTLVFDACFHKKRVL